MISRLLTYLGPYATIFLPDDGRFFRVMYGAWILAGLFCVLSALGTWLLLWIGIQSGGILRTYIFSWYMLRLAAPMSLFYLVDHRATTAIGMFDSKNRGRDLLSSVPRAGTIALPFVPVRLVKQDFALILIVALTSAVMAPQPNLSISPVTATSAMLITFSVAYGRPIFIKLYKIHNRTAVLLLTAMVLVIVFVPIAALNALVLFALVWYAGRLLERGLIEKLQHQDRCEGSIRAGDAAHVPDACELGWPSVAIAPRNHSAGLDHGDVLPFSLLLGLASFLAMAALHLHSGAEETPESIVQFFSLVVLILFSVFASLLSPIFFNPCAGLVQVRRVLPAPLRVLRSDVAFLTIYLAHIAGTIVSALLLNALHPTASIVALSLGIGLLPWIAWTCVCPANLTMPCRMSAGQFEPRRFTRL